ncbi:MAG: hypothetical protein ACW96M_01040 [Candidatus Thorarchaeota archaeon]|jgi:DNA-directed RNA polymerase sigma subunit (sigma70/sigma32)
MNDEFEDVSKIISALEEQVQTLETIHHRASSLEDIIGRDSEGFSLQDILSRINAVQNLVDRIEIEVDNLEMRVSAIEHMGFRVRTGGL